MNASPEALPQSDQLAYEGPAMPSIEQLPLDEVRQVEVAFAEIVEKLEAETPATLELRKPQPQKVYGPGDARRWKQP